MAPLNQLCRACQQISISHLEAPIHEKFPGWEETAVWVQGFSGKHGMKHLENAKDLQSSAETCALCDLIAKKFLAQNDDRGWEAVVERPIILSPFVVYGHSPWLDRSISNFPYSSQHRESALGMQVWIPINPELDYSHDGWSNFGLRFYTDDGSPHTFKYVASRLRLPDTDIPQTFSRIRRCMEACNRHHGDCKVLISGEKMSHFKKPMLPTRVIDIGPAGWSKDPVLLLTGNNMRGDYVALSHCWGGGKGILETTRANVDEHCRRIPLDKIPKTFSDAMRITRELGLRYLWIDSLCIIQHDSKDWEEEAERMGSVYGKATLVVAAADALNATVGCFFKNEEDPSRDLVPIPYRQWPSILPSYGTLYVGPDDEDLVPDERKGPLATRAWATQEWLLARRMAFFTKKGVIWSCKTIRCDPSGTNHDPSAVKTLEWQDVVEMHTSRNLTLFTDRLKSLEGILIEVKERDKTTYSHGILHKNLPSQLIWHVVGDAGPARRVDNPIDPPSWSWVSSMAPVRFLRDAPDPRFADLKGTNVDCGEIRIDGDAIVVPSGMTRKLRPSEWKKNQSRASRAEENDVDYEPIDYSTYDTTLFIYFDEDTPPSIEDGPLIALLLVTRFMALASNEDVYEEYFIILQQHREEGAAVPDTYVRVGAGLFQHEWRYNHGRGFSNYTTRSLRIV
ncbi:hypothetical protein M426DRAFT_323207 [Hypoxylon sp. CI-4A]|nr:hypothetical protein M426DRAFT_323207 [Hypoxylon sp. CI-4A]